MSWREAHAIKLDFEDLVKELDAFEQDIKTLQDRIDQFIADARQEPEDSGQVVEVAASGGDIVGGSRTRASTRKQAGIFPACCFLGQFY